jgi:hypothetical protein
MRDVEGRPLGESKLPPEELAGVAMEVRTCPYADSRQNNERAMNVSALKQMYAHWQEAVAGIALLRSLYCAGAKQEPLRLLDVWRIGGLTSSLMDFAFMRAWDPIGDGELPAPAAVVYKAPLGIAFTTGTMWSDGAARFDAVVDADALYKYADTHGHFIGAHQVCAGPVAMIKDVLHLVVDGRPAPGDPSAVARVIGNSARFMQFAHGAAALRLLRMAQDRLDAGMGFDLARALAADPGAQPLSSAARRNSRKARLLGFKAGARLELLDELLAHAADPRFVPPELQRYTRAIREAWVQPLEEAAPAIQRVIAASRQGRWLRPQTRSILGQHLGRFCAVEHSFAAAVRFIKRHIADALGVDLVHSQARELHLVDYTPSGIRLMRTIMRDALAIEASVQDDRVSLACAEKW